MEAAREGSLHSLISISHYTMGGIWVDYELLILFVLAVITASS